MLAGDGLRTDVTTANPLPHLLDPALADAPIGYAVFDLGWHVIAMNREAERLVGASSEKLRGRVLWDGLPQRNTPFEEACRFAVAQGHAVEWEQYEPSSKRWFYVNVAPCPDRVQMWVWDITPRKNAQERLEQSERRRRAMVDAALESQEQEHRALLEDLPAIVWERDLVRGCMTFVSRRIETVLGYPLCRWYAEPELWSDVVHPDDRPGKDAYWSDLLASDSMAGEFEARVLSADGTVVWIRDTVRILRDAQGRALRARGFGVDITEEHTAHDRLRSQEAQFRSLVEELPLAVYRESIDGGFATTYVSPQIETILGYPIDAWTDNPYFYDSLIHADDRERVLECVGRTCSTRHAFHEEFRLLAADGRTVWVEDHAVVVDSLDGPTLQGYILDITPRKAAETSHAESERRYQRLVEQLPLAVYVNELDSGTQRTLYISPQIEETLGYPVADWLSDTDLFDSLLHPDDRERVAAATATAHETGVFRDEYRLFGRDGRTVWFEDAAVRIEQDGRSLAQGYLLDVTERKRAEAQHEEAEHRYRTLVEQLPVVTYMNAAQPSIETLYVSPQVAHVTGYEAEEWIGKPGFFESVLHPDDREDVLGAIMHAHLHGERFSAVYRLIARDRRTVWIHDESGPVPGPDGAPLFIQGYFADVTQQKELEQQLFQAQKMEAVGRLAGGIAHDFNNLLTAIGGYAEFLHGGLRKLDPLRDDAAEIIRATDRAACLTRQLLAFSRRQVLQPRTFDLNDVVRDIEAMLRRLIGEDVELVLELDPAIALVRADPNQIEQVILNLAVNARDSMPAGGRVVIKTTTRELGGDEQVDLPAGRYTVMEVQDAGTGIPPEVLDQLFEPFFTTKEQGKGTGLGLATVYGIVKQSGGDIAVTTSVGLGSSFSIYLPPALEVDDALVGNLVAPAGGGTERVLVVEDEDSLRSLVRETLRRYGYDVVDASNADAALVAAAQSEPDILVTDIVMPGTGGHELAARMRESHPRAAILYMSGYTDDAIVRNALSRVGTLFLQKPFGAETLARKVREALDARRAA